MTVVLGALAGAGALTGADAGPAPADRQPHLLVVPSSADGQAALERTDARVIARYEAFTLVEASGADDVRLRHAGADRRDDMREVSLPEAKVDPLAGPSLAAKTAPDRAKALAVVQFEGPVKAAWIDHLEHTGAHVVQYLPQNGYLVHARGAEVDRLARLVGTDGAVRAVTPVTAADKVDAALAAGGGRGVALQTVAGDAGAAARRAARRAGRELAPPATVDRLRTQFLLLGGADMAALAADPGVVSITPWSAPQLQDERAAQIVAGNLTPAGAPDGPGYLDWLAGEGFDGSLFDFAIDVTDSGLDTGDLFPDHPDFYIDGVEPGVPRLEYVRDYTTDTGPGAARDCVGHGTNVASIAGGFGEGSTAAEQDSGGYQYGMGIAPAAKIGASKLFDCNFEFHPTTTYSNLVDQAYRLGARVSNNSWGIDAKGAYTAESAIYDGVARDARPDNSTNPATIGNQEMVEVFAAGNAGDGGSVDSPGTAKNVITVGASEGVRAVPGADGCGVSDAQANRAGDLLGLSSRGPTDDLRLKPDLVAPGSHVTGAAPQHSGYTDNDQVVVCNKAFPSGNPFYSLSSGTSQAAPHVAGAAALVRDWFEREHGGAPPSPAMTKAILTNSATDMAGGDSGRGAPIGPGPNNDQGWGRVNVGTALDDTDRVYRDQLDLINGTGATWSDSFAVADPARPLKVTLVWTDPPGPVGVDSLVNNLDLVVEAGGRTYKGNVFAGGVSISGGAADPRNNVESVFLPPGGDGRFAVRVVGSNIAGDGVPGDVDELDQDFALLVSNAVEAPGAPVLVHEASTATDGRPGGDGDGALEPGESFTLDERVRNGGSADATDVTGTLSPGPGLTGPPGTAGWDTIGAGATESSTTDAAGRVAASAVCGADATGTLTLTSTEDTQDIPITLPTGAPQPATANNRGHSPALVIPDGSSAGISSTINVGRPGRIKDMNVRIGAILHPWVGDLRIDLVGPDGTTVTLAEHPGGPDNPGHNLLGTVFDDEATTNISAGAAPYTGRFRPQHDQLSRFDGKNRQGNWTLRVRDLVKAHAGSLVSWGTETSRPACNFGPAPDTTIQSGPANPSAQTGATFTFTGTNAGGGFECSLDGALYAECASGRIYSGLAAGSHTFRVRAADATGNVDASPAIRTWRVVPPVDQVPPPDTGSAPPARTSPPSRTSPPVTPPAGDTTWPDFALVPVVLSRTDAVAGRLRALVGCASACRVSAKLGVSRAAARRLGGKRTIGAGSAFLGAGQISAVPVRLTRRARAATRRFASTKGRLAVTVSAGRRMLALKPTVKLYRTGGLKRIARGGLRLAGNCSERCSIQAGLRIGARQARRLRISRKRGPLTIAAGSTRPSVGPFRTRLRVARAYRRAIARAEALNAALVTKLRGTAGPIAEASRSLKLRP